MYFLTTISKWQGADSGGRVYGGSTDYLINPSNISEIVDATGGSRVLFCDNYNNAKSGMSYFWCDTTVDDIIEAADQGLPSNLYAMDVFYKNNPAKGTYETNVQYNDIVCAWEYTSNASYSWVIYQDGEAIHRILINRSLEEILDDMKYIDLIDFTGGVEDDFTTTIASTKEIYNVFIEDSGGNDITSTVTIRLEVSGGVWHVFIYSIDPLTGVKLKIIY
jgi:hypothetical protein